MDTNRESWQNTLNEIDDYFKKELNEENYHFFRIRFINYEFGINELIRIQNSKLIHGFISILNIIPDSITDYPNQKMVEIIEKNSESIYNQSFTKFIAQLNKIKEYSEEVEYYFSDLINIYFGKLIIIAFNNAGLSKELIIKLNNYGLSIIKNTDYSIKNEIYFPNNKLDDIYFNDFELVIKDMVKFCFYKLHNLEMLNRDFKSEKIHETFESLKDDNQLLNLHKKLIEEKLIVVDENNSFENFKKVFSKVKVNTINKIIWKESKRLLAYFIVQLFNKKYILDYEIWSITSDCFKYHKSGDILRTDLVQAKSQYLDSKNSLPGNYQKVDSLFN